MTAEEENKRGLQPGLGADTVTTYLESLSEAERAAKEKRLALLMEILEERHRQDAKWGEQNHDPFAWLTILTEEVGEASDAALTARFHKTSPPGAGSAEEFLRHKLAAYRTELVQITAVALAMIECIDRRKWIWGDDGRTRDFSALLEQARFSLEHFREIEEQNPDTIDADFTSLAGEIERAMPLNLGLAYIPKSIKKTP